MINRRNFLKTGGALGAAGVVGSAGLAAFTGTSRAAITTGFDPGGPVAVQNDTGDVTNVFLNPRSNVQWENFDVPVTKIRQLVEARLKDADGNVISPTASYTDGTQEGYWPIYRETPWLFRDPKSGESVDFNYDPDGDGSGTDKVLVKKGDGSPSYAYDAKAGTTGFIDYDLKPSESDRSDLGTMAIVIASEDYPKPDYRTADNTEKYLNGVSIGNANKNVTNADVNGQYGTVGNADNFDNDSDGTMVPTTVDLRLTTTVHTDYDYVENNPDGYSADRYDPLAMAAAPDVGHQFGTTTGFRYDELQSAAANHPAISVQTANFAVEATNETADSTSNTSGNAGAN